MSERQRKDDVLAPARCLSRDKFLNPRTRPWDIDIHRTHLEHVEHIVSGAIERMNERLAGIKKKHAW